MPSLCASRHGPRQQTFVIDATDALVTACQDSGQSQGTCRVDLDIEIEAAGTGRVDALWFLDVEVSDDVAEPVIALSPR